MRIPDIKKVHSILSALAVPVIPVLLLGSCSKDAGPGEPAPPTVNPPAAKIEYMDLNTASAYQMTISGSAADYEITTTGTDPYIYTMPLEKANHADSIVLSFEYQSSSDINNLQFFFGPPIEQARSVIGDLNMPASPGNWTKWTGMFKKPIEDFEWGSAGDVIRFDFGGEKDKTFRIRNIYLRGMTGQEAEEYQAGIEKEADVLRRAENIRNYLAADFTSQITHVAAGLDNITVTGVYGGDGSFSLCEITPYQDIAEPGAFEYQYPLTDASFTEQYLRFVEREGFIYDRTFSKWAVIKHGQTDELASHARYADEITPEKNPPEFIPANKKGIGLGISQEQIDDRRAMNITNGVFNLALSQWMSFSSTAGSTAHQYGGRTYYFFNDMPHYDDVLENAYQNDLLTAAIVLLPIPKGSNSAMEELLLHPDHTKQGHFAMPNMQTSSSVNAYAAGLDFWAKRYSDEGTRIHHWIMHNEIDIALDWTNMGLKPMEMVMDNYIKSMRLCYNIVRRYDPNAQVLASFTHSWTLALGRENFASRDMIDMLKDFCTKEGDFQWGLAYHSYPQDLNEPKTWNDGTATFSMNTQRITFHNLEVLDKWSKMPENMYKGTEKRLIWLSENGTNSRSYSEEHLAEQAAGLAYAWKKVAALDGIDYMIYHNFVDNLGELELFGIRMGLRKFDTDPDDPLGKKPVWYVYEAAGTEREDEVFEPYRERFNIPGWGVLQPVSDF